MHLRRKTWYIRVNLGVRSLRYDIRSQNTGLSYLVYSISVYKQLVQTISNLSSLSLNFFFSIVILLTKAKQSGCNFINFLLIIINLEVIIKKFLNLKNLIRAQIFYVYKLIKVFILYEYKNPLFTVF